MTDHFADDKFSSIAIAPASPAKKEPQDSGRPGGHRLKRLLGGLLVMAGGYGLYLLAGFTIIPVLLGSHLPDKLTAMLNRPVTVGEARFNPFSLAITLQDGAIGPAAGEAGPLLSFSRWRLDVDLVSLVKKGLVCSSMQVDQLLLHVVRQQDLTYNIFSLPPGAPAPPAAGPFASGFAGRPFSLNNIHITNSRLIFDDVATGQQHVVEEIDLALPVLSNLPYQAAAYIRPRFSARINGSPVEITGQTQIRSEGMETRLKLRLTDIDVPAYLKYLPRQPGLDFTRGRADVDLDLLFAAGRPAAGKLQVEGAVRLKDLWLQDSTGRELVKITAATLEGRGNPLVNRWHLASLVLNKPELFLQRTADQTWQVPDFKLLFRGASVKLDSFLVQNGRLSIVDRFITGGFSDVWSDINLTVKNFDSGAQQAADVTISGRNKEHTRLAGQGKIHAAPFKAELQLTVDNLLLPPLQPYFNALGRPGHQVKSGTASLAGHLVMAANGRSGPDLRLAGLDLNLRNLVLAESDREWLQLPILAARQARLDLKDRHFDLGQVHAENVFLLLSRAKPGPGQANGRERPPAAQPWQINLQALTLEHAALTIEDHAFGDPLKLYLREISLAAKDFTGNKGRLNCTASVNGHGRLRLAGTLSLSPFGLRLETELEQLALAGLRPLFNSWFGAEVVSGTFAARGDLHLPDFSFAGTAEITDFAAAGRGADPGQPGPVIIRWQKAAAREVKMTAAPLALMVGATDLDRPFLAWSWAEKGGSSLDNIVSLAPAGQNGEQAASMPVVFEIIRLNRGELVFTDQRPSPPYRAVISDLNGSVAGLDNQPGKRAFYALRGVVDASAPLIFSGEIGSFDEQLFADFAASVSDLDLLALAPYIEPHLGWKVKAGKLNMTTTYRQKQGRVEAENRLDLTAFQLGKWLQGNTSLPLTLALLTDPAGHIKLEIPVNGAVEDPAFSFRADFVQVFRQLLLKTAVTPFSVLGSVFKIEQPLDHLDFAYGETKLTDDVRGRLAELVRILEKRPWLTIEIKGWADASGDREALLAERRRQVNRRLLAEASRHSTAITSTYGQEEIPSSLLAAGSPATAAPADFRIEDQALHQLGRDRALQIRQYLVEELHIAPERVSINQQTSLTPANSLGRPGNRVDFVLGSMEK